MTVGIRSLDLAEPERALRAALANPRDAALPIIGFGEISTAFAWPPHEPRWVLKSLPRFPDADRYDAYAGLVQDYARELATRGVPVAETAVRAGTDGRSGFLVQPLLPAAALAVHVARSSATDGSALLHRVVEHILTVVDDRIGLDAQLSNWALVDDELTLLDLGQPFLRDAHGADRLDVAAFCQVYPAPLRPALRRLVFPDVIAEYHDPRLVLRDLAFNLLKEDLGGLVPVVLDRAADHGISLTEHEVTRAYTRNRRTWTVLQALRRADRAWQLRVRRRPYPVLLPTEAYRR